MLAESLPSRPAVLPVGLHPAENALLPPALPRIHNFGATLKPRWIVGAGLLDQ